MQQRNSELSAALLAKISHELRTPLSLIVCPLEEELKKHPGSESLHLMMKSASRLMELANQLSELACMAPGFSQLRLQRGDVRSCLAAAVAGFDLRSEQKEIKFNKVIDPGEWPEVWFDEVQLQRIISHLLMHAVRVTFPGGIVSFTAHLEWVNFNPVLQLTVCDAGGGITEEQKACLLSPLWQAVNIESSNGCQGFALSLSMVSELVKAYGGTIACKSILSLGTRFVVTLPASREAFARKGFVSAKVNASSTEGIPAEDDAEVVNTGNQPAMDTILVIEDDPDLIKFMVSCLASKFYIKTATNREEGLTLAFAIIPDLIITGLVMPKSEGLGLVKEIRADERTSHIPIILLTGRNTLHSRLEALEAGADDYLSKPFSTEELLVRITNLIVQRRRLAENYREEMMNIHSVLSKKLTIEENFLQQAKSVVESNLSDAMFSVSKMADELHINRTHLLRKLKSLTGMAPNDYIRKMRLEKAAEMIRLRVNTITQAGYAVGFNDQSYFTKCFKKHFGMTPREFFASHST